jgi:hypothetical protein
MSLETVYYIGQTVAVIAILGSLVFVAYQTRQTSRLARTELTRSLLAETRAFGDNLASSPELSEFIFNSRNATEMLEPKEFFRLAMYYASWFTGVESAFKIHKQNLMDASVYEHIRITTRTLDCVNMHIWWQIARNAYAADFASDVDDAFADWDKRKAASRSKAG